MESGEKEILTRWSALTVQLFRVPLSWTVGEVAAPMTVRFGAGKQHQTSPCSSFFFLSTLLVSVAAAALPATSFAAAALAAALS